VGALNDLLSVQTTDIELTQAAFRLAHLPEREAFVTADANLRAVTARRDELTAECSHLESEISSLESHSADLDSQVGRLEKQLKTVIAPREAEALQHEIAQRRTERSAHDDRELELMESLEQQRSMLEDLARDIAAATERRDGAARALKAAKGVVDAEIVRLTEQRSAQALVVPATLLEVYERKRKARPEGAVATMHGPTCGSCHMDLARTEIDALRALPEGEYPECPQCGCFIVL
jgi:predicted  nucleic acid-binding Zn-ribbon protein